MKMSCSTDIGIVREENQDSVFVHAFDDYSGVFIVADGMGGYEGGKLASSKAVETIFDVIQKKWTPSMTDKQILELLKKSVKSANKEIFDIAVQNPQLYGMGTTVVVCIIKNEMLYTANVGDSRCYVCNKRELVQITKDHSLVYDLISRGLITKEEARNHPQRNVITRAVGSEEDVTVDVFATQLFNKDVVMLCSDGLHSMVSENDIKTILKRYSTNAANKLIKSANENGGLDNISVITVKISDEVK